MPRQQSGIGRTDMPDAKRIYQAVERNTAARVDRVEQVAYRCLAVALALDKLLLGASVALFEGKDVGRRHHQPVGKECLHLLLPKALDVESVARHEMTQPLDLLRRADESPGAAAHRFTLLAHGVAAASRTELGKFIGLGAF